MNRGGYSGGPGGHHYGGMGYNGGYGMGPGPGPMHNYHSGGGMIGGGGGGSGNITNSNDPKSKASRVFLGNLNTGFVKRPEVEQVFRKYGQILGISLHNGFGFIQYSNEHSAKSAVMEEQGRVMAYQPLDLRIASDPDKNRPKGFKRVQGDCFGGYVDPKQIPVHPSSGSGPNGSTRKRMKTFIESTNIKTEEKEGDGNDKELTEHRIAVCHLHSGYLSGSTLTDNIIKEAILFSIIQNHLSGSAVFARSKYSHHGNLLNMLTKPMTSRYSWRSQRIKIYRRMDHVSAPSVPPQGMGNGIGRLGGMMGALQNIIDRNSPGNLTNSTHPNDLASRLFIGNLNTGLVTRQNIEHIFSQYGKITGISLHKGFGFVQFTKGDDAMAAKQKEHGRILASQPLDLHIANEPDRERPKGFKRVQDEAKYTGYVDPTLLPIHPTSGPPAKRKKEEGDEPDDWQCSICDEITPTAWQLIKHAATIHELVIYRDNKAIQAMQTS